MYIEGRKTENGGKCLLAVGDGYEVQIWEGGQLVKMTSYPTYEEAYEAYLK